MPDLTSPLRLANVTALLALRALQPGDTLVMQTTTGGATAAVQTGPVVGSATVKETL